MIMAKNADAFDRRPAVFSSFRFDNLQEEGFPKSLCFILKG